MTTIPEEPDSDWTQTAYLFCDRLGIKRKADALHICEGITAAIQAAEKRGREEAAKEFIERQNEINRELSEILQILRRSTN